MRNSRHSPPRAGLALPGLVLVAALAAFTAPASRAGTVIVDDQVQLRESPGERPKRGSSMSEVEAKFGAPSSRHAPVGAPPITRWDYAGFSVFFEHDRVIHSVVTNG